MDNKGTGMIILMADDDEDDRFDAKMAMKEATVVNELRFVENGEELLDYLYQRNQFSDPASSPRPGLILLDLNMPRMDGREALEVIKSDPELKRIPVVVLTTSKADEDIIKTADLGANSYIQKPVTFDGLVEVMKTLSKYWIEIVNRTPQSESD